jgi:hypothetical protein
MDIAIDATTGEETDGFFCKYRLKTPILSICEVPGKASIVWTPLIHFSWRYGKLPGLFQSAPFFARIGRLGIGIL